MSTQDERVCIIGAGPAGLLAAAALQKRGIPFEIVDGGRQVGGIWDIDRDETPLFESAHFISSRMLSGIPGFPMPESYPDYPRHDRILEYIRSFADHHDLERHVTFGVRVVSAPRRESGGWRFLLDSGEERACGAICVATGTTWQPRLPDVRGNWDGEAYHAFHYRSPREFEGKRVLIVGGATRASISPVMRPRPPTGRFSAYAAVTTSSPSTCSDNRPTFLRMRDPSCPDGWRNGSSGS